MRKFFCLMLLVFLFTHEEKLSRVKIFSGMFLGAGPTLLMRSSHLPENVWLKGMLTGPVCGILIPKKNQNI